MTTTNGRNQVRFRRLAERRVRIPVQDKLLRDMNDMERLRNAINDIPDIAKKHFRMDNRVRLGPGKSAMLTDFVVDVDESAEKDVKDAFNSAGFKIRGTPLHEQKRVLAAVQRLAKRHSKDKEATPEFIVWFRLEDTSDVHLLEVSKSISDYGDGRLEGIAMDAGAAVPGAHLVVLYLAAPSELHAAFKLNKDHRAIRDLREGHCELLHPKDKWDEFKKVFPEVK